MQAKELHPEEPQNALPCVPPFIWPEPRFHAEHACYAERPPFGSVFANADLISGVLVGVTDLTVTWLRELMGISRQRTVKLVVIVYPASPTRHEHLLALKLLQCQFVGSPTDLQVRVLPVDRAYGSDHEKMVMQPTILQAHHSDSHKTFFCVGSVGDAGHDAMHLASFNAVFRPDAGFVDNFRNWFEYLWQTAAALTPKTVLVPYFVPPEGDPASGDLWTAFKLACHVSCGQAASPCVDLKTGEVVTDAHGAKIEAWDQGKTALDPLARMLQPIYANGWLVTVEETTKAPPLAIPVKPNSLGQMSHRTVGRLTQTQSFRLDILKEETAGEVDECRQVSDLMELLTFPLSKGYRWIPEAAKPLLEAQLDARNERGRAALLKALGGGNIEEFVQKRSQAIRENLTEMYHQLGQKGEVPEDKFNMVLAEAGKRLSAALKARITPRVVYCKVAPPDLTTGAPPENWIHPLSLLLHAARLMRESMIAKSFASKCKGVSLDPKVAISAMNIFQDSILENHPKLTNEQFIADLEKDGIAGFGEAMRALEAIFGPRNPSKVRSAAQQAKDELVTLDEIEATDKTAKEKCSAVWEIISGIPDLGGEE